MHLHRGPGSLDGLGGLVYLVKLNTRGCHRITGTLVGLNALLELESLVMMYVHVDVCSGGLTVRVSVYV